uniref:Pyruvate kinase n=1 Tax=Vitis vinifera TaxID=29760 RepID=F6H7V3_VITVI
MLDTMGLEVRSGDFPKPIMLKEGQEFYFTIKRGVSSENSQLIDGGELKSRRCLNVRGKRATLPSITDKNWEDIKFGVDNQVDFYVVSFVKDAEVVHELKDYLKFCEADIHVTVKIESADSIPNLHSIISSSDGKIMGTFWREREGYQETAHKSTGE